MDGLVTTIIPVFNRPVLLREAVESVLGQTYRPIEILIVDDGSTDSTPEMIQELASSAPAVVRGIRRQNSGPGAAREAGRQVARGEFIQYLDSDDLLLPTKFERQVNALRSSRECEIAYGKTQFARIGLTAPEEAGRGTGQRYEYLFPHLLRSRWWYTNTPLYRRSLTDRIGPWKNFSNEEDWEYDARAGQLGARLCYCDEFVSVQRVHEPTKHLCHGGSKEPKKLSERAKARELILTYALTAGVMLDQPEMQHFARSLFLLSRQCGAAGLAAESQRLFELARKASTPARAAGMDFRLYRALAGVFGWRTIGSLAQAADRLRDILRA